MTCCVESFPQCVCWHCASGCAPFVSCPNYRCLYSFTIEWKKPRSHLRWCVTTMLMSSSPLLYCVVCEQPTYWCSLFFSANHATLPCPWVSAHRVTSQTLESTQMGGGPDIGARTIPKELLVITSGADVCVGMSGWCHSSLSHAKQPDMSRSTAAHRIPTDQHRGTGRDLL